MTPTPSTQHRHTRLTWLDLFLFPHTGLIFLFLEEGDGCGSVGGGGGCISNVTQTYCVRFVLLLLPLLALYSHQESVMCVSLDLCDSFFGNWIMFQSGEKGVNFILIHVWCGWPKASLTREARRASVAAGAQNLQAAFFCILVAKMLFQSAWARLVTCRGTKPHFIVQTALSWVGFTVLSWHLTGLHWEENVPFFWLTWLPFWLCMIIVYLYRWWCRWQWEQCRCVWAYKLYF